MAANKIIYNSADGEQVLMDLTSDTVTADTLAEGATAHDATGKKITGAAPRDAVRYATAQSLSPEEQLTARLNIGAGAQHSIFDTFPTEAQINALSSGSYFSTRGFYSKNDGLACTYRVLSSASSLYVPYGNMYYAPVNVVDGVKRDIFVDYYGIRRGDASHAGRNSEIINTLVSSLNNGFTLHFGSGHYYFSTAITFAVNVCIKGAATNAIGGSYAVNYGTFLHFPTIATNNAAIYVPGGNIQDIGLVGNPSVCDVSLDRSKTVTDPDNIVTFTDGGITYGIKTGAWGFAIQNVRVMNFTYGIYSETSNALLNCVHLRKCKYGASVGNDTKINNVHASECMVAIQLRGALASATNVRGDGIGKHLIECLGNKCNLTNVDGDYVLGSLVHYGNGTSRYMHLGQLIGGMGRIAIKTAFERSAGFDLRSLAELDYEYCSYISIAPNTKVFGGHIELANVKATPLDSSSGYLHSDAAISIGAGCTVMGLTIKYNVPYDADLEYFNTQVIKSLSDYAEATNDTSLYETNFDGKTIEAIAFITPLGIINSSRTTEAPFRAVKIQLPLMEMLDTIDVLIPSKNICDNIWEYGRFAAAGTEYNSDSPISRSFRSVNYWPVTGGETIAMYYDAAEWNSNNKGLAMQIVQYDATKTILVARQDITPYVANKATFTLDANTAYIRLCRPQHSAAIETPLEDIKLGLYYLQDYVPEVLPSEPSAGTENALNLKHAVISSSTEGSTKKFRLTIDDAGIIAATEISA